MNDLVEHMVGQNYGFAAAIASGDAPESAYEPRARDQWTHSTTLLTDAISAPAERIRLVEVRPDDHLPLEVVLAIHTLDLAVHTWDAIGDQYRPDEQVIDLVLAVAQAVPAEQGPSSPFGPAVGIEPADPWERALRLLGRRV